MNTPRRLKFLVVDDFSTMRRIVRGLLKEMGHDNVDEAEDSLKHIPVLMVTAEARKEDIVMAAQSGAAGYIVKPFTRATLEERLNKILQRMAAAPGKEGA